MDEEPILYFQILFVSIQGGKVSGNFALPAIVRHNEKHCHREVLESNNVKAALKTRTKTVE